MMMMIVITIRLDLYAGTCAGCQRGQGKGDRKRKKAGKDTSSSSSNPPSTASPHKPDKTQTPNQAKNSTVKRLKISDDSPNNPNRRTPLSQPSQVVAGFPANMPMNLNNLNNLNLQHLALAHPSLGLGAMMGLALPPHMQNQMPMVISAQQQAQFTQQLQAQMQQQVRSLSLFSLSFLSLLLFFLKRHVEESISMFYS